MFPLLSVTKIFNLKKKYSFQKKRYSFQKLKKKKIKFNFYRETIFK